MDLLKLILFFITMQCGHAATNKYLSSLRFPIVSQNKILFVNTTCNATNMIVIVHMDKPFKGLLATKDFSQECRSMGTMEDTVHLNIPTSGCGVRLSANTTDGKLYYSVTLVAQQDRLLRQVTDQEQTIHCKLRDSAMKLRSEPMFEALKNEVNEGDSLDSRTGRMRTGWKGSRKQEASTPAPDLLDKEIENVLSAARAWMEISPKKSEYMSERVQVGDPTLLSVKSTLPAGIGWRVVDCVAHDGIGDISQRLLDEIGCPIDETILPALTVSNPKILGKKTNSVTVMRHQEAVTSFPAFKFPDRDRLHVTCGLQLCRGKCLPVDCRDVNENSTRGSRRLIKGEQGEVLDRLEVFNSVEVIAPGIELEDFRNSDLLTNDGNKRKPVLEIPGDRTFCVSPNKMAIAFCILGVIFLIAVVVALCSLMRARRTGGPIPYYTRSLFSSSSSGSAYGGSKLLLHESPTMGQTRHWRIL